MGRRQFESVVAQAPKIKILEMNLTNSVSLIPGDSEVMDIYSSPGTKSALKALYFNANAPTGSASGWHHMKLYNQSAVIGTKPVYIQGQSVFNSGLLFNHGVFITFDNTTTFPKGEEGQIAAINNVLFDDTKALRAYYRNNTNVNQTNVRTWFFLFEEMETR